MVDGASRRGNVDGAAADAGGCGGGSGADASGVEEGAGFTHSIVAASKLDRPGMKVTAKQAAPIGNDCRNLFMPEPN